MILLKSPSEIVKMRAANRIVAELLDAFVPMIKAGVNTLELDEYATKYITQRGGRPAFKGYTVSGLPPFPAAICASVNEGIVHGIPSAKTILEDGDIIGIDVGVELDGYFGDGARTYGVGSISQAAQKLLDVTKTALQLGIEAAQPNARVGDISHAIQSYVRSQGFYCADNLTGHGIGRALHEDPQIPNIGQAGRGPRLKAGMTIAIEPMVNIGTNRVKERGWEFFTADGSLSAHFEHTIHISASGPEILTVAGENQ
ncbi:MAG: type I methionyl aminopeptidase [Candidatus Cloacimonetes bacterium]|nr:type I methionyl aminopeptidase [Candidatus Cloacimonadota bacterium]